MEPDRSSECGEIHWLLHPFHGPTDHLSKNDPRRSGTFNSDPSTLHALGTPIRLPTLTPDETDLAILNRHYPNADSAKPPWHDVRADLLAAGVPLATVQDATSRDLMRMLDRVCTFRQAKELPKNERKETSLSNDLSPRENKILSVLGDKTMQAPAIADAVPCQNNSTFRTILSNLVKRKHLVKSPDGSGYLRS